MKGGYPFGTKSKRKVYDYGLSDMVNLIEETSGQLNPPWVEWLMGFPAGWTALEP